MRVYVVVDERMVDGCCCCETRIKKIFLNRDKAMSYCSLVGGSVVIEEYVAEDENISDDVTYCYVVYEKNGRSRESTFQFSIVSGGIFDSSEESVNLTLMDVHPKYLRITLRRQLSSDSLEEVIREKYLKVCQSMAHDFESVLDCKYWGMCIGVESFVEFLVEKYSKIVEDLSEQ